MEATLRMYKATEIPRGNKPIDPRANPKYFDYTWTNWMDIIDPKTLNGVLEEEESRLNFSSIEKHPILSEIETDVEIVVV